MPENSPENIQEKQTLQHFLDAQRSSVLAIVKGLDETALRSPALPSRWTPIGMIKHLGGAEQHWFQDVALGRVLDYSWPDAVDDPYDPDAPFTTRHTTETVFGLYRHQCEISDEVLATTPLDAVPKGLHNEEWEGGHQRPSLDRPAYDRGDGQACGTPRCRTRTAGWHNRPRPALIPQKHDHGCTSLLMRRGYRSS